MKKESKIIKVLIQIMSDLTVDLIDIIKEILVLEKKFNDTSNTKRIFIVFYTQLLQKTMILK